MQVYTGTATSTGYLRKAGAKWRSRTSKTLSLSLIRIHTFECIWKYHARKERSNTRVCVQCLFPHMVAFTCEISQTNTSRKNYVRSVFLGLLCELVMYVPSTLNLVKTLGLVEF